MPIDILSPEWLDYQDLYVEVADEYLAVTDSPQFLHIGLDSRLVAFQEKQGWTKEDISQANADSIDYLSRQSRPVCWVSYVP